MVGVVGFAVGENAMVAIEAGGGGEDEFLSAGLAGVFEHVEGSGGVGVHIQPGVEDAVADTGDGGKVDDGGGMGQEVSQGWDGAAVRDVEVSELEAGEGAQTGEAVFFHAHVIVGVHVVDAENGVPFLEEEFADSGGDKSGGAGYEVG